MQNLASNQKKFWQWGFFVSLLLHSLLFLILTVKTSFSFNFNKNLVQEKPVSVNIFNPSQEKKTKILTQKNYNDPSLEPKSNKLFKNSLSAPFIDNALNCLIENKKNQSLEKVKETKPSVIKEVVLNDSLIDKELKKTPAYMGYYNNMRQKIKDKAYQYYKSNFNGNDSGSISLNFTIENNGQLKEVQVSKNSLNNQELQNIALKSIQEAAPFGDFPKSLKNYFNRQFTVTICFKKPKNS